MFVAGVWCSATGFGKPALDLASSLYANIVRFSFDPSLSFFGNFGANILSVFLLSVFTGIDGLVVGYLGGTLYNAFCPREQGK